MNAAKRKIVLCSCEGTMQPAAAAVALALPGAEIAETSHLCGADLATFRRIAADGEVMVACTAMRTLFEDVAEDEALAGRLTFANIRETAGWSREGDAAGPKMAALLAAAAIPDAPPPSITLESEGVALIYGSDQRAIDAAERLKDRLDITVLLVPGSTVQPPRRWEYPIRQGRIRTLGGHLGAFALTVDGFASPRASSRATLAFGAGQDGALSKADMVIDLSGGASLLPAPDLREGYLRADPDNPLSVAATIARAADLTGTFDKPRYITFREDLCAHARSRIVGCRRCLDLCPAGAITPDGNHVAIDPYICAGCGQCASACPTGAASYAVPTVDRLIERVRTALAAYRAAGGTAPQLLLHDVDHGEALIDAAARFGDGLAARTIPLAIAEVTLLGLETIAAAFAYGAASVQILTRARPRHDGAALQAAVATADALLAALGFGAGCVALVDTDEPDQLLERLRVAPVARVAAKPAAFLPVGGKRDILRTSLRELHRVAPAPVDVVSLPKGAAFGRVVVDSAGCTLCLACVSACPTRALSDSPDRPRLAFDESLCVQCGLCAATCPEKVIALEPRIAFNAFEAPPVALKEEEPFCCITCGKAFGVKSTIERITQRLAGRHWMFSGDNQSRIDLVRMCEDCRVEAAVNANVDPFAGPARPAARTTEDYLAERDAKAKEAAMRDKIEKGEA